MSRVLFIPHSSEPSGAPRVTVDLAQRLAARGWEVEVALPTNDGIAEWVRRGHLKYHVLGYPAGSFAASSKSQRLAMGMTRVMALGRLWVHLMRRRPKVAWVGSSVAVPFLLTCRAAGVRTVVHVHESPEMSEGHPWRLRLVRRLAHGIVFVGRGPRAPFEPRPRGRTWKSLANPMDPALPITEETRTGLRESLAASADNIVFICAAFLSPRKDHETLLRAFALAKMRVPRIRLWIVGGEVASHEGINKRLRKMADELDIADSVCFAGLREDVPALMQAADVCVLTSRAEAMPLSIAEAQLAGRPVIATRVGDIPLMVPDGICGFLVEPEDVEALARNLARMAMDSDLRRQFGARARKRAGRLYASEVLMTQFEAFIRRVAGA